MVWGFYILNSGRGDGGSLIPGVWGEGGSVLGLVWVRGKGDSP